MKNKEKPTIDDFVFGIMLFPFKKFRSFLWHFILLMLTVFFTAFLIDIYFAVAHKFINQLL
jgi:hypothetical protein